MVIVPISGKAGSGKDEFAIKLKKMLTKQGKRVCIIHFADYLKYICLQYKNWNGLKDKEGRTLLQKTGTEEMRAEENDFWVHITCRVISACLRNLYDVFLIPDTRFDNEIDYVKEFFKFENDVAVCSLRISRVGYVNKSLNNEQKNHPSEIGLDNYNKFDYYADVLEGKNFLIEEAEMFVNYLNKYYSYTWEGSTV